MKRSALSRALLALVVAAIWLLHLHQSVEFEGGVRRAVALAIIVSGFLFLMLAPSLAILAVWSRTPAGPVAAIAIALFTLAQSAYYFRIEPALSWKELLAADVIRLGVAVTVVVGERVAFRLGRDH